VHYRPDIDGLRAVAVLAVIAFHLGSWLPGGFAGVDIFFVISGYLITGRIVLDIERGVFSAPAFYARRIKRIFPAMLLVTSATLVAGRVLLMPGDYAALGSSASWAAASFANVYFLRNTGYFDNAAELMPLLHTWSLGVEEQFYLIAPLLIVALMVVLRCSRVGVLLVCGALGLVSFAAGNWLLQIDPKAAFYLSPVRAWELAAGSLVAIAPLHWWQRNRFVTEACGIAGVALIAASLFGLSQASAFPGYRALLPVAGAALIVAPWAYASTVRRLLSARPLVFVGLLSFSLYLWHWPVLVFWRHYTSSSSIPLAEGGALIALTFVLSWLTWRYVEQPVRKMPLPRWPAIGCGLAAAVSVGAAGLSIALVKGFPSRIPEHARGLASLSKMWEWKYTEKIPFANSTYYVVGAPWHEARQRGVLWGDSHAQHFASVLDAPARDAGVSLLVYRTCPAFISKEVRRHFPTMPQYNDWCEERRDDLLSMLRERRDIGLLVMAAAWASVVTVLEETDSARKLALMRRGFDHLLGEVSKIGLRTMIIADVPSWPSNDLVACLQAHEAGLLRRPCPSKDLPRDVIDRNHAATNQLLRSLSERWPVSVIVPVDAMCDRQRCITALNGEFLYRDAGHLRRNLSPETLRKLAALLGLKL
jgi:peptidoglycan/LPS O-acetylase OafA/YrhL